MRSLLLALAIVAAGCVGPEVAEPAEEPSVEPPPPPRATPLAGPLAFHPATRIGYGPGEPFLHASADGTLFLRYGPFPSVYRSRDHGSTFARAADTEGYDDAVVASDRNGTLFAAAMAGSNDGTIAIVVERSSDGGESWTATTVASGRFDDAWPDRPWIAVDSGGVHVVWRWRPGALVAARSDDGGATWTEPVEIAPDAPLSGPIVVARSGALVVPFLELASGLVRVARSEDRGRSWNATDAVPGAMIPVVAEDAAGTLYLATAVARPGRLASYSGPTSVVLSVSHDGGRAWSAPISLSSPGTSATLPWIVAGDAGGVAVAWYESTREEDRGVPDLWYVAVAASSDADAEAPTFHTARTTEEPVHVGNVCRQCALGGNAPSFLPVGLGGPSDPRLDHLGLALDADGHLVVAYVADEPGALSGVVATQVAESQVLRATTDEWSERARRP